MRRKTGPTKWFSWRKSKGFTNPDDGEQDFYSYKPNGNGKYRDLYEGGALEYDHIDPRRRPQRKSDW